MQAGIGGIEQAVVFLLRAVRIVAQLLHLVVVSDQMRCRFTPLSLNSCSPPRMISIMPV